MAAGVRGKHGRQIRSYLVSISLTLLFLLIIQGCQDTALLNAARKTVDAPQFSLSEGTYSSDQTVSITDSIEGATIYFTTDGSTPTRLSPTYAQPILIAGHGTVKTIKTFAIKENMNDSAIASATYTINYDTVSTPQFSLSEGTYSSDQSIVISDNTSGAIIRYTTDGTVPIESSTLYSNPITITGPDTSVTIKAIGIKAGMATSTVASASYKIIYVYDLTVISSTGGSATPSGVTQVNHGAATAISATPDSDHGFLNWTVTSGTGVNFADANSANTTLALTAGPATVRATFGSKIFTVAGNGVGGGYYPADNGGPATAARLHWPLGVAVDAASNIFIADYGEVRKVDTSGIISTVAGGGVGGDGGPATSASLKCSGLTANWSGNLIIAGWESNRIRWVDTSGIIHTTAGTGTAGDTGDEGPATSAQLSAPFGVTMDTIGNVFIADSGNQRIRKVDQDPAPYLIHTYAGNGNSQYSGDGGHATDASLCMPSGVVLDNSGNLYIADTGNNCIRKVDTQEPPHIITFAGNGTSGYDGDGGPATSAKLNQPYGLAIDSSGNLYIADTNNSRIRKVDVSGIITTVAGTGDAGYNGDGIIATTAQLSGPMGVAIDPAGYIVIADSGNMRVRRVKQ